MITQVIQSFWNSPGFLGIGITQVKGETYLYLNPDYIDWQKKTLLQLELQNNVQSFVLFYNMMKSCQIEIMGYAVNILKLENEVVISVLSEPNANNLPAIDNLKLLGDRLEEAINVLVTFSQNPVTMPTFLKKRTAAAGKETVLLAPSTSYSNDKSSAVFLDLKKTEILQTREIIDLLTRVIKFSSKYIGTKIAVSYLQATRPQVEWLQKFVIADSAEINFTGTIIDDVGSTQLIWLREWVAEFSKKCSRIFPYLPVMLEKKCLTEREKKILALLPK
jgi:hypothetical protein